MCNVKCKMGCRSQSSALSASLRWCQPEAVTAPVMVQRRRRGGCYQRGVPVEEEEEGGRLTVCFNNRLSAGETSRHLSGPHYTPLYPPATDAHGCNSYTFQLENRIVTEI